jgi:heavy metal translocating P-type ATPase
LSHSSDEDPLTLHTVGMIALAVAGAPVVWRTGRDALRGRFATDIVASLSIVGALLLQQPLAGLVIVLMQRGGEMLERYAARRASRAIQALEDASPRVAHRVDGDASVDIDVDLVRVGDLLLLRPGELVPADSVVVSGASWIDASRLTGESVPIDVGPGSPLMSGSSNGDRPITIRATARAAESQYARIVQHVRTAQASKAPLQRLADQYATWFTPLTLAICAATFVYSRDWMLVLAVLVVATPCPLILATPVAMVGGISHAARHGVIVRHGGALEALARVTVAVFDKTGTLTVGKPSVSKVIAAPPWDRTTVLRLAGSVEEGSGHQLARSIVAAALEHGGNLPTALGVHESPGRGVSGTVSDHRIAVGSRGYMLEELEVDERRLRALENGGGTLRAFVAINGDPVAAIEFADTVRPNVRETLERLRRAGIERTILLSGDSATYVRTVAEQVGIIDARGNMLPGDKVAVVAQMVQAGEHVLMVGDGVNDAPALSQADVGIALAAHGRGIASEAADVVLLKDEVLGVADAVEIGRKTMRVARQSIGVGLGLSVVAMGFAVTGFLSPTMGAITQEMIDVAVILNALRTSSD